MMKLFKNEDAFTGLEAAIVLIAFVVVRGLLMHDARRRVLRDPGGAADRSHRSQQASSSMEIIGNVYGHAQTGTEAYLDYIEFTVGNLLAGGSPIDITQTLVTYVCGKVGRYTYDDTGSIGVKRWKWRDRAR